SITGELAGTVALVVYALGAGGAALVAAYAASRTVAGMGGALVLTGLTNRLRRDRLLRWSTAIRTLLLAGAARPGAARPAPRAAPAAGGVAGGGARQFAARGHLPPAAGRRFALAGAHAGRARRVQCRHRRDGELRGPGWAAAGRRPARRGRPGRRHGRGGW